MRKRDFISVWLGWALLATPALIHAQQLPPFSYYLSATNKTSTVLKSALHDIIDGHTVIPYRSQTATHDPKFMPTG